LFVVGRKREHCVPVNGRGRRKASFVRSMKSRNKNELIEVEYFSQAFGDGEMTEVEGVK